MTPFKSANQRKAVMAKLRESQIFPKISPFFYLGSNQIIKRKNEYRLGTLNKGKSFIVEDQFTAIRFVKRNSAERFLKSIRKIDTK